MQITARPIAADAWAYFKLLTNTVENVSWMYFVDIIFAINARKFRNCAWITEHIHFVNLFWPMIR